MPIYSQETVEISFGSGLYSADLPSAIPDGFCAAATNVVPTGTSVESRYGFRKSSVVFTNRVMPAYDDRDECFVTRFESNQGNTLPAIAWGTKEGASPLMHLLRDGNVMTNPVTPVLSDGYIIINLGAKGSFRGAVNYNGTMYYNTTVGVYRVSAITWGGSPSVTDVSVSGPVGCTTGLFHFQDRLWTSVGNRICYTNPPSSPGGLPNDWNTANNFIVVVGEKGPARIYSMIPLGTRIYIFTNQGMFILSIHGSPSDWYLKAADSKVRVNTVNCAFEVSGVIYYICSLGVFATTGSSTVKISGSIENLFLAGNQVAGDVTGIRKFTEYRIQYLDGGMIISISPQILKDNGGYVRPYYAGEECKILYSRTDSIAWSEWEFPPSNWGTDDPPAYDSRIHAVIGVVDNVQTYVNNTPLSYLWLSHSRGLSTDPPASVDYPVLQLFNYDGFEDSWTQYTGPTPAELSRPINGLIRSHFFNGGDPVAYKEFKVAYLDLYMPNPEAYVNKDETTLLPKPYWRYRWLTDQRTYTPDSRILYEQEVPDTHAQEFSIMKMQTQFVYRTAQLELRFSLEDDTNYKIKSVYLKEFTQRDALNQQQ